jgi:hypothetical protein
MEAISLGCGTVHGLRGLSRSPTRALSVGRSHTREAAVPQSKQTAGARAEEPGVEAAAERVRELNERMVGS